MHVLRACGTMIYTVGKNYQRLANGKKETREKVQKM